MASPSASSLGATTTPAAAKSRSPARSMGRQPGRRMACQFCRVRKLKCSRVFPCSNCTSRGVACPSSAPGLAGADGAPVCNSSSEPSPPETAGGGHGDDILTRVARLEALLASRPWELQAQAQAQPQPQPQPQLLPHTMPAQLPLPRPPHAQTQPLPLQARAAERPLPNKIQGLVDDAVTMQHWCHTLTAIDPMPPYPFIVRLCPIQLFTEIASSQGRAPAGPGHVRKIWLPHRAEAALLVRKYLDDITFLQQAVHGPSLHRVVDEVYDCLDVGSQIAPGHLLILLAIFSITTWLWTYSNEEEMELFPSARDANAQCPLWIDLAREVLDGSQSLAAASMEYVQGLIIIGSTIMNQEGVTARGLSLVHRAITMAREIGLHRIDYRPRVSHGLSHPILTGIKAEIGRRIWWCLVWVDWVMTATSSPQRGTYTIHPNHMAVNKPQNADDEDFTADGGLVGRPMRQLTSMSYALLRLRLAEELRSVVDRAPLSGFAPSETDYTHVLDFDAALLQIIREVPPLMGDEGVDDSTPMGSKPVVILQRYLMTMSIHGQRTRLHLPYLARSTVDDQYAYSRKVAIRSAWIIIRAEDELRSGNHAYAATRFRLIMALHGYFLAVATLVLDLCLDADGPEKAEKLRAIEPAWWVFQGALRESATIFPAAELLARVMDKHSISFETRNEKMEPDAATGPAAVGVGGGPMMSWEDFVAQVVQQQPPLTSNGVSEAGGDIVMDRAPDDVYYNMACLLEQPLF